MGCHTWFSVPYLIGREEIKKVAMEYLHGKKQTRKSTNYWAEHGDAIENDHDKLALIAAHYIDGLATCIDNTIYLNVGDYERIKYNLHTGKKLKRYDDLPDLYSEHDAFRILDYPQDVVIRSYEEAVELICTYEYSEDQSKRSALRVDECSYERLKIFFTRYPDGIITFG